jgi:class 3 adenylate cyclase
MAEIVGGQMGLSDTGLRLLRYAAILHDIGKTGVPGSVLRSTAPLTAEQSAMIADHTVIGESIVARINFLSPIAPIIRSAHERWDGGGYPDRLRGEDIPMASRIVFACDACHAMVSDRPYRKAMTHEAAFVELVDNAGAQFDPRVAEALVASRDAIERLLQQGPQAAQEARRVLATVMVTDIVGSTGKAAEMGDTAYRDLLDRHHATVRSVLRRYRGSEIDTAGDGFLATFDGAARAVECAAAIGRELAPLGLEIRAGCHTGEIEVTGAAARGIAVHIGARVAALAEPGEILVSSIVKDLVTGSGLAFRDRGEHELKGVPGSWRLYAVVPGE